jgi:hypothetical protein
MVTGKMHGSVNQRTRERMADGLDDFAMAVSLGGRYVVRRGEQEIALDDGEATLFSMGRLCSLLHWPPGHLLSSRCGFPVADRAAHHGRGRRLHATPLH